MTHEWVKYIKDIDLTYLTNVLDLMGTSEWKETKDNFLLEATTTYLFTVKPNWIHNSYAGNGPKRSEFSRDKMRLSNPASEAEIASVDMSSSEKMVVASNKNSSLISFYSDAPIRSRTFVK